jgi:hypothetical protein
MAKGRVGELESRAIEIIYFEEQREKRLAKKGTKKKKELGTGRVAQAVRVPA